MGNCQQPQNGPQNDGTTVPILKSCELWSASTNEIVDTQWPLFYLL